MTHDEIELQRLESLRQVARDLIEREMEANDPVAAYDAAEREAWEAAGVKNAD